MIGVAIILGVMASQHARRWEVLPDRLVWERSDDVSCVIRGTPDERVEPFGKQGSWNVDLAPIARTVAAGDRRRLRYDQSSSRDGDLRTLHVSIHGIQDRWMLDVGTYQIRSRLADGAITPKVQIREKDELQVIGLDACGRHLVVQTDRGDLVEFDAEGMVVRRTRIETLRSSLLWGMVEGADLVWWTDRMGTGTLQDFHGSRRIMYEGAVVGADQSRAIVANEGSWMGLSLDGQVVLDGPPGRWRVRALGGARVEWVDRLTGASGPLFATRAMPMDGKSRFQTETCLYWSTFQSLQRVDDQGVTDLGDGEVRDCNSFAVLIVDVRRTATRSVIPDWRILDHDGRVLLRGMCAIPILAEDLAYVVRRRDDVERGPYVPSADVFDLSTGTHLRTIDLDPGVE